MRGIGGTIFWLGLVSCIVHFAHMELLVFMWMNDLAPNVAWGIRFGCIAVGGVMWLVGRQQERKVRDELGLAPEGQPTYGRHENDG